MTTWKDAYDPSWEDGPNIKCADMGLTSLDGAPASVAGFFRCSNNELTSLEGAPAHIGGYFYCSFNKLESLKDIHLHIKHIGGFASFRDNPIKSHVLGLLLIDGLFGAMLPNVEVDAIINSHFPSKGIESLLLCQEELINAGLEEYAQL